MPERFTDIRTDCKEKVLRFVQQLIDVKRQYMAPPPKNDQNLMTSLRKIVTCPENCSVIFGITSTNSETNTRFC